MALLLQFYRTESVTARTIQIINHHAVDEISDLQRYIQEGARP